MKKKLMRAAVPVLLAALLARSAEAQVRPNLPPQAPGSADSLRVSLELLPDSLAAVPAAPDSARLAWLRTAPELRDLVGDRIGCLETDVPHVFNNHVLSFVRLFTERQRAYTQRVLERENLYFPLFEKYLTKYNLPTDLKYLAVVESALVPTAKSRVGATGLWQFMGPTANDLRLRRDDWVDERMDPEKATEAACKHLRYLYGVFHDWEMVLAAYNWGAGNMQRVMRKTGKSTYWEVHSSLPAETRNYVPTFTALLYTMKYAQAHQLHAPTLKYQYAQVMDTLQLGGRAFDLTRLARACGYDDSLALLRLNPELRKPYLPAGYRNYTLLLPAAARPALAVADRHTLFAYCQPVADLPRPLAPRAVALNGVRAFPGRSLVADAAPREPVHDASPRFRRVRHTVKQGETVASVAARYDVSSAQVRRWNELGKSASLAGRRQLVVFVALPPEPAAATGSVAAAPALPRPVVAPERVAASKPAPPAEVPATAPETVAVAPPRPQPRSSARNGSRVAPAETLAAADDSVPATYVVLPGDFLEKIATANGLTIAQLKAWNQLTSYVLQPGQTLSLRAATEAAEDLAEATREVAAAAQAPVRRAARPVPAPTALVVPPAPQLHLVQPGDTLYNISRRYQGLTVEKLRELNHLQSDAVKPGQKLIVKS
ncbi:LysM peptidoglycan-binding domain-containing protein [Hymenobacter rubripertinctus]|uniref:LysM peptidoglycan-binding domain-containing protein n=1 Tax=Hymenobacter rubripertinctus TaxID=2029981 RepID=A0A418QUI6_9BACT|nr:LysM peptidoglycan-binding domain-containing protein [Hymenobacter rubripertinctus]RIY08906.1 LysM peptidoglycan-binding domain-containing protein [Hymenobacter rubripertinctus]